MPAGTPCRRTAPLRAPLWVPPPPWRAHSIIGGLLTFVAVRNCHGPQKRNLFFLVTRWRASIFIESNMSVLYANCMDAHDTDDKFDYPPLTAEEWQVVREHEPERRGRVLSSLLSTPSEAAKREGASDVSAEAAFRHGARSD